MDRSYTIKISPGTIITIALVTILCFLVYYLRGLVVIIIASLVIASATEPAIQWMLTKRVPRLVGVILIYAALVVALILFFYFLLPTLLADISVFLNSLPRYIDLDFVGGPSNFFGFRNAFQNIAASNNVSDFITSLSTAITSSSSSETFLGILASVFGGSLGLVLIAVMSFYLAAQPDGVDKFLRLITPREHEAYIIDLWKRSQQKISYWFQGQLLLAVVVAALVYLGLLALGIEHALLLAVIVGIFEIIPVFGPIIGAIPGVITGILDGGVTMGFLVAALYIVVQQLESNILYPLVIKKLIGVPPLLVIIALVAGFELGGILGALVAVPVAAVLVEYSDDIRRSKAPEPHPEPPFV
jgi:predicted PurR-regulated permease PerM